MRVYRYDPVACGVPDGGIRFGRTGIEYVFDPDVADVLLVPCNLYELGTGAARDRRLVEAFPRIAQIPERHLLCELIEHTPPPAIPGICYVRAALTPAVLAAYPTAVAWPWAVGNGHFGSDLGDRLDEAALSAHCTHDVAFVGWRTPQGRTRAVCDAAVASVRATFGDRAILETFDDFHGHRVPDGETARRESLFTDAMRAARFQLAPASAAGVLRYRVFEALRAGRIPVIVDDAVVLPRSDVVPWPEVSIHVPTAEAGNTGAIVSEWMAGKTAEDWVALRDRARSAWLRAFDGRRQDDLLAEVAWTHILEKHGRR